MSSSSESSGGNPDTWQDLNPDDDNESLTFTSLIDPSRTFTSLAETLSEAAAAGLDLPATIRRLGLDFHGSVRLVNYLRTQAKAGGSVKGGDVKAEDFAAEEFLKMVLENDAVVFELDEILEAQGEESEAEKRARVAEEDLETVKTQFESYRLAVQETLEKKWEDKAETSGSDGKKWENNSYFESYAYHGRCFLGPGLWTWLIGRYP